MDTNHDMRKKEKIILQSTNYRSFNPKEKNFMTVKMKNGGLDQVLFSQPHYNAIGDPYLDPKGLDLRSLSSKTRRDMHGKEFITGGKFKTKTEAGFLNTPNKSPMSIHLSKTHGPRGFFTSPLKHGIGPGTLIQNKNYEHMIDEYDRKKDIDREERKYRRSQQLSRPFSNVVVGRKTFGNDKDEFGEDRLSIAEKKTKLGYEGVKHEVPFKYSNESKWIGKTINKHPDYETQGPEESTTDRLKKMRNYLPWRPNYNRKSEPNPSVTANFMNKPNYPFM